MAVEKLMIIVPPAVSSEAIKPKTNMPTGAITVLAEASRQVEVELLDTVAAGFEKRLNDPEYQLERSFAVDECDVKLVGLSVKEIVERVRRSAADVIGISCLTLTDLPQTRVITDAIREALPKIPIIVGGSEFINYHPEFGHFRELPSVDYLGIGPGQRLINSFLDYLNSPTGSRPQGIVFKDGYYKPFQTQFDPNQFALPDYSLLPTVDIGGSKSLDLYSKIGMTHAGDHKILFGQENMPYLPIVTSYGCPHECKFCDPESQHTQYTPENIMTMLDQAKQLFGLGYVDLLDNNFAGRTTQSRAKAFAILDAIKQLQLQIGFSNGLTMPAMRSNDYELLHRVYEAGDVRHIGMPCESGSDRVLEMTNKPHRTAMVKEVLEYTAKTFPNLHKEGFFLGGFPAFPPDNPAESPEELAQTVALIDECLERNWLDQASFFIVSPVSPVLRKMWKKAHPDASYATCLYSTASSLWPHGQAILEDTRRQVADLHTKHEKTQSRYPEK